MATCKSILNCFLTLYDIRVQCVCGVIRFHGALHLQNANTDWRRTLTLNQVYISCLFDTSNVTSHYFSVFVFDRISVRFKFGIHKVADKICSALSSKKE